MGQLPCTPQNFTLKFGVEGVTLLPATFVPLIIPSVDSTFVRRRKNNKTHHFVIGVKFLVS
jgi:hypothetical protein